MGFDTAAFTFLNALSGQSPFLDRAIVFFAADLAYLLILLFFVFVFFSAYSRRKKLEILAVTILSTLIARFAVTELIRSFYHRPRPFLDLSAHKLLFITSSWSFPSGHATFFFALATAVFLYNRRWGVFFFVAAMLMTICRVIAGVHYLSDVAGGAIIGVSIAYFVYQGVCRLRPKATPLDLLTK